tara:strand:+ start:15972 stop:16493 length:522 start_codon:yes stop_codon:yes gene_type:complete
MENEMDSKNKYRFLLIGFISMLILNIAVIGSVWYLKPPRNITDFNNRGQRTFQPFERELNLSREQMDTFKKLRDEYRTNVSDIFQNIQQSKRMLFMELQSGNDQKVDSLVAEIGKGHEALERMNFNHFRALSSNLREDQKEAFRKTMRTMINLENRRGGPSSSGPPDSPRRGN